MEALAAHGQRGRGPARVRSAADAAARRARARRLRRRRSPRTSGCCVPARGRTGGRRSDEPQAAESIQLPAELRARGAAPLVGRERELEELERLWAQARDAAPLQRRRSEGRSCCSPVTPGSARLGWWRRSPAERMARGVRARRPLAGGGAGALPAVRRGAPSLRAQRPVRRAARRARASTVPSWPGWCPSCAAAPRSCPRRSKASPKPSATGCSRPSSGC